jgi:dihydrofolate reductase
MAGMSILVARSRNGVIGSGGGLPWRLPEDLAHFKRTTMGHAIVMGRVTWDSIGRPLPGRRSIVVTRNRGWSAPGAEVAHDLASAMRLAEGGQSFLVGGAQLYGQALALPAGAIDGLIVTEIDADFEGDTYFASPDPARWRVVTREAHAPAPGRAFGFAIVTYKPMAPAAPQPTP